MKPFGFDLFPLGRALFWERGELSPLDGYQGHFEEICNTLRRAQGFLLLPVEVPSRDIGRALYSYLHERKLCDKLIAPGPEEWATLPDSLLSLPKAAAGEGAVFVLGPPEKIKELLLGLQRINLSRDRLAQHLGRPLLWCGLSFFLEETWQNAPDFWSVRDITAKIPLLAMHQQWYYLKLDPFARKPQGVEGLLERVSALRALKDELNLGRILLDLAQAYLAGGRAADAGVLLQEAEQIFLALKDAGNTNFYRRPEAGRLYELQGDLAASLKSQSDAMGRYQEALDIYQNLADPLGSARVLAKLGLTAARTGDGEASKGFFAEAFQRMEGVEDDQLWAELLYARGGGEDLDKALQLFEKLGDEWGRGRVLLSRGKRRIDSIDYEGARKDIEQATAMMERTGDVLGLASGHLLKGYVLLQLKQVAEAEGELNQAIEAARRYKDPYALACALRYRGFSRIGKYPLQTPFNWSALQHFFESTHSGQWQSDYAKTQKDQSDAIEIIKELALPKEQADIYFERSLAYILFLRPDKAIIDCDKAHRLCQKQGRHRNEAGILMLRAISHESLGEFELAHRDYEAALAIARSLSDSQFMTTVLRRLAMHEWLRRRFSQALAYQEEIVQMAEETKDLKLLARELFYQAFTHLVLDHEREAREIAEKLKALTRPLNAQECEQEAKTVLKMLSWPHTPRKIIINIALRTVGAAHGQGQRLLLWLGRRSSRA